MSWALPFATTVTWDSNENGAVPSGILGKVYFDAKNGVLVQVVKNTDASVISGCELVRWETASGFAVDKTGTSGMTTGAGICHPDYATAGKTIPINSAFLIVKQGRTTCLAGAAIAAGNKIIADGTDGRIQPGTAVGDGNYGVCFEAGSAGAASVICDVSFPAA